MSRKLALTQKQVTAICKGASKAGYVPVIEVEGLSIRLIPEQYALSNTPNAELDDLEIRF
jgi:hypothetical protein